MCGCFCKYPSWILNYSDIHIHVSLNGSVSFQYNRPILSVLWAARCAVHQLNISLLQPLQQFPLIDGLDVRMLLLPLFVLPFQSIICQGDFTYVVCTSMGIVLLSTSCVCLKGDLSLKHLQSAAAVSCIFAITSWRLSNCVVRWLLSHLVTGTRTKLY